MNQILASLQANLKGQSSLFTIEEALIQTLGDLFSLVMTAYLENLDTRLYQDLTGAKVLRRDRRTINGLMGTIQFKRRRVQYMDGTTGYPLDKALCLIKRRRYSPLMTSIVAELASNSPYRVIEKAVDALTPTSISHMTVGTMVKAAGHDLDTVRHSEVEDDILAQKRVSKSILYLEGDAFEVRIKGGKRAMVHRFQVFEGVTYCGKRHVLTNRYIVTNVNRRQAINEMSAYLRQHYDLSQTLVITSSDNGSGYEPGVFKELALGAQSQQHFLDRYHLSRKLKERLPQQPALTRKLRKALYRGDWDAVDVCLDTAESLAISDDPKEYQQQTESVEKLRGYLSRNWNYIKPFSDAGLMASLSGLGSCESNHRRYTYRLKHQGRSWSRDGLKAMLRIIDAQQNQEYQAELIKASQLSERTIIPQVANVTREVLKAPFTPHVGVQAGCVAVDAATSSSIGQLAKIFTVNNRW